jgi:hypothetical protein
MEKKMHEQYHVQIMHRHDEKEGRWLNAIADYYPHKPFQKYVATLEEAKKVLDCAYEYWNGHKVYDSNGERRTTQAAGMIGVSMVHTKETDKDLEIVKHRIRKRMVTDWELVEEE